MVELSTSCLYVISPSGELSLGVVDTAYDATGSPAAMVAALEDLRREVRALEEAQVRLRVHGARRLTGAHEIRAVLQTRHFTAVVVKRAYVVMFFDALYWGVQLIARAAGDGVGLAVMKNLSVVLPFAGAIALMVLGWCAIVFRRRIVLVLYIVLMSVSTFTLLPYADVLYVFIALRVLDVASCWQLWHVMLADDQRAAAQLASLQASSRRALQIAGQMDAIVSRAKTIAATADAIAQGTALEFSSGSNDDNVEVAALAQGRVLAAVSELRSLLSHLPALMTSSQSDTATLDRDLMITLPTLTTVFTGSSARASQVPVTPPQRAVNAVILSAPTSLRPAPASREFVFTGGGNTRNSRRPAVGGPPSVSRGPAAGTRVNPLRVQQLHSLHQQRVPSTTTNEAHIPSPAYVVAVPRDDAVPGRSVAPAANEVLRCPPLSGVAPRQVAAADVIRGSEGMSSPPQAPVRTASAQPEWENAASAATVQWRSTTAMRPSPNPTVMSSQEVRQPLGELPTSARILLPATRTVDERRWPQPPAAQPDDSQGARPQLVRIGRDRPPPWTRPLEAQLPPPLPPDTTSLRP